MKWKFYAPRIKSSCVTVLCILALYSSENKARRQSHHHRMIWKFLRPKHRRLLRDRTLHSRFHLMFINQPFCTHRLAISKAGQTVSECTIFKNVCELASQRFWVSGRPCGPVDASRVTSLEHDVRFPRVLTVQVSPGPSTPSLESFWRNYPKTSQGNCLTPPRAKATLVDVYVYYFCPTSYGFGFWH